MRSHSTVVSYTDKLRKILPRDLVRSTNHSGSFSSDILPYRRQPLKQTKSSSVHILYTGDQSLTSLERKVSFVSESDATLRRKSTPSEYDIADAVNENETPIRKSSLSENEVIQQRIEIRTDDGRRTNAFEECERKATSLYTNGNALYDVDFMIRLNSMALRLTEQIGMIFYFNYLKDGGRLYLLIQLLKSTCLIPLILKGK